MSESREALAGLTVVDAATHPGGAFAARLFADHGAEVVLVPTSGAQIRPGTLLHGERPAAGVAGAQYRHLHRGKRRALIELDDHPSAEFLRLCSGADVVILDPKLADQLAGAVAEATAVTTVSDFGDRGPYAHWTGSELVHQALSGSMYMNGSSATPPLYGCGMRASYAAGLFAYIGTLASLIGRVRGRRVRRLDVSVHEAAAAMEQNFSSMYAYNRLVTGRAQRLRPAGQALCADGWVKFFATANTWPSFCEAFDAPQLASDERFAAWPNLVRNWLAAVDELNAAAAALTVAEVMSVAIERHLVIAPILTPEQLFDDEQLAARSFWVDDPDAGPGHRNLGPMFRFSETPARPASSAPLAIHDPTGNIGDAPRRGRDHASTIEADQHADRPLEGLRIVDLTTAWAGPMATRLLALLGADVVKVEGPTRVDGWRGPLSDPALTHDYPDELPGDRPYDRHGWFNSQNHEKRAIALDLKHPEGLRLARALAAESDAVIANFSAGTLDRMGFGHAALAERRPDIVVVEMPGMGSGGPLANLRALGPTMEALSGIASLIGTPELGPIGSGTAYLDPMGALHGAAAALTGIYHVQAGGCGQQIEVAQREAALHWIGEFLLGVQDGAIAPVAIGNDRPGSAPHGAYPTRGDDEWIVIDAPGDDAFAALCEHLGVAALVTDPRFASPGARWTNRTELNALLAERTAQHERRVLAARLQRRGVAAAPVCNGADLLSDPQLAARQWFTPLTHAAAGTHAYPGLPFVYDACRLVPRRPSPTFGEHNDEVLTTVLRCEHDEIATWRAAGIVADTPIRAR